MRLSLNKDLGFTREDRAENVRRVSEVARVLYDAGLVVIVALVSPYAEDRAQARKLFPDGDFYEAWVNTPASICSERDPKGLYKKAAEGSLPNLTGINQSYEPPSDEVRELDGTMGVEENVEILLGDIS